MAVAAVDIDEASLPQRVLSPREFQLVMSFLLGFVKKDKQADGLLERLLVRLSLAQTRYKAIFDSRLYVYLTRAHMYI